MSVAQKSGKDDPPEHLILKTQPQSIINKKSAIMCHHLTTNHFMQMRAAKSQTDPFNSIKDQN